MLTRSTDNYSFLEPFLQLYTYHTGMLRNRSDKDSAFKVILEYKDAETITNTLKRPNRELVEITVPET